MEALLLKSAIAALQLDQIAIHFFVRMGWLSSLFILVHNIKPDSHQIRKWFWTFAFSSFLGPILFFATNWLIGYYGFHPLSVPTREAAIWAGLWIGGLVLAIFWLRYAVPTINTALVKFKRGTALERNLKTDVREIDKFLPTGAIEFDPLKFVDLKNGIFLGLDERRRPVYIDFPKGTAAPHVQVVGTTGEGKGVSLGIMSAQFLERGEAVFFLDPKDDEWSPHVLHHAAQRAGKPFHFIDLNRPNGAQFDLFSGATEEEIFELFQAGFSLTEKGDASDFYGIADRREAQTTAKLMAGKGLNIAQAYAAIPLEAYEYVVNGKPALDWVVERQCVKTDKDSGIVNDANDWAMETMGNPRYALELFQRVITVSLETMKIVRSLPRLDIVAQ